MISTEKTANLLLFSPSFCERSERCRSLISSPPHCVISLECSSHLQSQDASNAARLRLSSARRLVRRCDGRLTENSRRRSECSSLLSRAGAEFPTERVASFAPTAAMRIQVQLEHATESISQRIPCIPRPRCATSALMLMQSNAVACYIVTEGGGEQVIGSGNIRKCIHVLFKSLLAFECREMFLNCDGETDLRNSIQQFPTIICSDQKLNQTKTSFHWSKKLTAGLIQIIRIDSDNENRCGQWHLELSHICGRHNLTFARCQMKTIHLLHDKNRIELMFWFNCEDWNRWQHV